MNERIIHEASRKHLFEAANYLLCQLALQIQQLERNNENDSRRQRTEQTEEKKAE
jgi:hypothetical protein